jgi:hypothetical protein
VPVRTREKPRADYSGERQPKFVAVPDGEGSGQHAPAVRLPFPGEEREHPDLTIEYIEEEVKKYRDRKRKDCRASFQLGQNA